MRLLSLFAALLLLAACGEADDSTRAAGSGEDSALPSYPLDDTLRINEVAMRCTHNSYHIQRPILLDDSHNYTHAPLDIQLGEQGIRAFELDIHAGDEFPVFHIPLADNLSTCPNLGTCLGTIATWSRANPDHSLIVVWIEMKDELDGVLRIRDYEALDAVIRTSLGELLYAPDDLQAEFASPRARLDEAGWPTLGETRGRVALVMLDTDEPHASGYTRGFTSTAGRAMFARVDEAFYDAPWAVFAKVNNPEDDAAIAAAHAADLMIASNVADAGSDDAGNAAGLAAGIRNGSHMLCDDFPMPAEGRSYYLRLPGGSPSICNAVTASEACTAAAIEDHPMSIQPAE